VTSESQVAIWKSIVMSGTNQLELEDSWKLQPAVKTEYSHGPLMVCIHWQNCELAHINICVHISASFNFYLVSDFDWELMTDVQSIIFWFETDNHKSISLWKCHIIPMQYNINTSSYIWMICWYFAFLEFYCFFADWEYAFIQLKITFVVCFLLAHSKWRSMADRC